MENIGSNKECTPKVGYSCVPIQQFRDMYNYEDALKFGTAFPELNLPLGVYGKKAFGGNADG